MFLDLALETDKKGKIKNARSFYEPTEKERERLTQIRDLFAVANEVRNTPFREFNDYSLVDRINIDRMSWGQYVEPPSMDPDEEWKSRAFRSITRDKIIAIAAHVTAAVIFPTIYAQNDKDEADKDAAMVMRDIMEWVNERSGYESAFMSAVIHSLFDPCAYVSTEYVERFRMDRKKGEEPKRVLDEFLSGLKDFFIPCDEIWPTNIYEPDLQKQPVFRRRVVEYADAKARYGGNKNFDEYVCPGLQLVMGDDAFFYETYDQSLSQRLVEEVILWDRYNDLKLTMINGVLVSDPDEPNPRNDKLIPYEKLIYEYVSGKFFYGKSLAFKLNPDEELVNTTYRMVSDGTFLQLMPPAVAFGVDNVPNAVMIPGAVTTFDNVANPQASFAPINTGNNLTAGYNLLNKVEGNISEASSNDLASGQAPVGAETAYEISRVEQNARILLGLFGKMIARAVRGWGTMKIGDIVQHMTVGEVSELMSPGGMMKYRKFLLPEKKAEGTVKSRLIEFDATIPDEMTEDELMEESRKVQKREVKNGMKIYRVNPERFRKLKYEVVVKAEALVPDSPAMQKARKLEKYALGKADPNLDQKVVTREWLLGADEDDYADSDKFMAKEQTVASPPSTAPAQGRHQLSKQFRTQLNAQEGVTPAAI